VGREREGTPADFVRFGARTVSRTELSAGNNSTKSPKEKKKKAQERTAPKT